MTKSILPLLILMLFPLNSLAQESRMSAEPEKTERFFRLNAAMSTIAPTWAGPQVGLLLGGRLSVYAGYGSMPSSYLDGLDSLQKENGSTDRERELANAALRDNRGILMGIEYRPTSELGWKIGLAKQQLKATGKADLRKFANEEDQGIASAAGTVLNTLGVDTTADSNITMNVEHVYVGYAWSLGDRWTLDAQIGASHIESSSAQLSTRMSAFDDSDVGQKFLAEKEAELERTLRGDVWAPNLGVSASVWF